MTRKDVSATHLDMWLCDTSEFAERCLCLGRDRLEYEFDQFVSLLVERTRYCAWIEELNAVIGAWRGVGERR